MALKSENAALLAEIELRDELATGGSSGVDELTGLPNRRTFTQRVASEAGRARRCGQPLALCIFQIRGLERVNAELGRSAGDDVLRRIGAIISGARIEDETFRVGGCQFAVLMPQTPREGAEAVAARFSASLVAAGLGRGRVSASFGAAASDGDPVALHEDAVQDLRLAKRRRVARRPRRSEDLLPRTVAVIRSRTLAAAT